MALIMKFKDLLEHEAEDYFWTKSDCVFRPSTMFSEIIYHYLESLEVSHQTLKVHQWGERTIANNLQFVGYNHKIISFSEGPVPATDFDNQRANDYKDVGKFIPMVHGFYMMPEISEKNCPELLNFLECLSNPMGEELLIKKHYCLWDCNMRFNFFAKFQNHYVQGQFADYFERTLEKWLEGKDFKAQYPDGFFHDIENEPLLNQIFTYERSQAYEDTLSDVIRFARNLNAHYSKDTKGNPQTVREAEWKFFVRFPFLMLAFHEILTSMNMYNQFAD